MSKLNKAQLAVPRSTIKKKATADIFFENKNWSSRAESLAVATSTRWARCQGWYRHFMSSQSKRAEWACPRCTLLNPITEKTCNACGTARPFVKFSGKDAKNSWTCPTCTFSNTGGSQCTMCNTLRPSPGMSDELKRINSMNARSQQLTQMVEAQTKRRASVPQAASKSGDGNTNWVIQRMYVRREYKECLQHIERRVRACGGAKGSCEFALYIKALILRHQGKIDESLQLFRLVTTINPQNIRNIKQVARSLYLLGKQQAALQIYNEALEIDNNDREIYHNRGLCHMHLKEYGKAIEAFESANDIQPHDSTYIQLGKLFVLQNKYEEAVQIYEEALENSPENPVLLTTLGLLFLRMNETFKAFKKLGAALALDPTSDKGNLASGSIIQDHQDYDVALHRYRRAAAQTPNSAHLWNNIGMCFFGKKLYIAAISCLKRALYLDPFEWIISYNLGLVHLCTKQYASAFHFLNASINLKPSFSSSYMYLAVILEKLDDFDNACNAYERAIEMDSDYLFHLNYAITLYKHQKFRESMEQFRRASRLFDELDEESKSNDMDAMKRLAQLEKALRVEV